MAGGAVDLAMPAGASKTLSHGLGRCGLGLTGRWRKGGAAAIAWCVVCGVRCAVCVVYVVCVVCGV